MKEDKNQCVTVLSKFYLKGSLFYDLVANIFGKLNRKYRILG